MAETVELADHLGDDLEGDSHMTRCDHCGSDDLFRVQLAPQGKPVLHSTCRHCEHRWWHDVEGSRPREIALSDVLEHLAAR